MWAESDCRRNKRNRTNILAAALFFCVYTYIHTLIIEQACNFFALWFIYYLSIYLYISLALLFSDNTGVLRYCLFVGWDDLWKLFTPLVCVVLSILFGFVGIEDFSSASLRTREVAVYQFSLSLTACIKMVAYTLIFAHPSLLLSYFTTKY